MGLFSKKQEHRKKSYTTMQLMPTIGFVPKWSPFSKRAAINEGYRRSTWVYSCIRLRAANLSAVPWVVKTKQGDEWVENEAHELARLLARPNPSMDFSSFMRQWIYNLDLSGDAYASIIATESGRPLELWPMIPDVMDVVPGQEKLILAYRYRKGPIQKTIPAEEVLHLKYSHPGDVYFGLSPLEAAGRAVDIDEEAEKWQKVSLQNMAVPPGAYVLDGNVTQQQYDQARQWVGEQSGPENARRPMVLANVKWQQLAQNATDLDFTNGRKMTREEICSAYSVPPPLVGIYDNATLSNIETARQIFWREGLIPVLDEISGQLNAQLAYRYSEDVRIEYDLTNVEALADNYNEKVNAARVLWGMGVPLTRINDRLDLMLDLDGVAGVDVGYLGSGLLPADMEFTDPIPGGTDTAKGVYE
jgi:HK97 family phage portal protein